MRPLIGVALTRVHKPCMFPSSGRNWPSRPAFSGSQSSPRGRASGHTTPAWGGWRSLASPGTCRWRCGHRPAPADSPSMGLDQNQNHTNHAKTKYLDIWLHCIHWRRISQQKGNRNGNGQQKAHIRSRCCASCLVAGNPIFQQERLRIIARELILAARLTNGNGYWPFSQRQH